MKNYNINIFDLNVYIENNEKITKLIQNKLKERNLSIKGLARRIKLSHSTIYPFLKGAAMKSQNLRKIFDFLSIYESEIEQSDLTIYSGPYKFRKYHINFPIELTPLHIRVISHFLGDGSLEKHGCRWYQKSNLGGRKMIDLILYLTGIKIKKGAKDSYGIPIILGEIVCSALDLCRKDLKTSRLVDAVNSLPKEFKIQLLAAFIVDEGHVTKSSIKICNTNLELMESLEKVISSLDYPCSEIKKYGNRVGKEIKIKNNKSRVNFNLYNLFIRADGLLRFKEDLDLMIKKYGDIAGLWQKQDALSRFSYKVDLDRLSKTKTSKNDLIPLIKKEIIEGPISIKEFARKQKLDYIRAYKLFFRLKQKCEIKRISIGVFASNNYNGPTNLTLKSRIEQLLGEGQTSLNEITNLTNGSLKSVSSQLCRLCKEGKAKKIKRGVYSRP